MRICVSVHDFEVQIGRNAEFADMTNPQGIIYQTEYGISASTDYGMVYGYNGPVAHLGHANVVQAIVERQIKRGDLDIEASEEWSFRRYVYGSKAFQDNYGEAEISMMDSEEIQFHAQQGTLPC